MDELAESLAETMDAYREVSPHGQFYRIVNWATGMVTSTSLASRRARISLYCNDWWITHRPHVTDDESRRRAKLWNALGLLIDDAISLGGTK